jgi:Putative Actinobacterial Holin-X, holin superfamily III
MEGEGTRETAATASRHHDDPVADGASGQPTAELIKQLSEQTTTLVRQELELARAELAVKGKQAGLGAGMFGGAGLFGLYAVGALTACLILALTEAVDGWLAALIVAAVYGAIAGVLALTGKTKVRQGTPPVPEQTVESVKEDVEWTKQRAREGRR